MSGSRIEGVDGGLIEYDQAYEDEMDAFNADTFGDDDHESAAPLNFLPPPGNPLAALMQQSKLISKQAIDHGTPPGLSKHVSSPVKQISGRTRPGSTPEKKRPEVSRGDALQVRGNAVHVGPPTEAFRVGAVHVGPPTEVLRGNAVHVGAPTEVSRLGALQVGAHTEVSRLGAINVGAPEILTAGPLSSFFGAQRNLSPRHVAVPPPRVAAPPPPPPPPPREDGASPPPPARDYGASPPPLARDYGASPPPPPARAYPESPPPPRGFYEESQTVYEKPHNTYGCMSIHVNPVQIFPSPFTNLQRQQALAGSLDLHKWGKQQHSFVGEGLMSAKDKEFVTKIQLNQMVALGGGGSQTYKGKFTFARSLGGPGPVEKVSEGLGKRQYASVFHPRKVVAGVCGGVSVGGVARAVEEIYDVLIDVADVDEYIATLHPMAEEKISEAISERTALLDKITNLIVNNLMTVHAGKAGQCKTLAIDAIVQLLQPSQTDSEAEARRTLIFRRVPENVQAVYIDMLERLVGE